MNLRPTLFGKIIGWLLLNLAVLALGAALVFREHIMPSPEALLRGKGGQRLEAAAGLIVEELQQASRDDFDRILERHEQAHGMVFLLFRENGEQLGGRPLELPGEVRQAAFGGNQFVKRRAMLAEQRERPPLPDSGTGGRRFADAPDHTQDEGPAHFAVNPPGPFRPPMAADRRLGILGRYAVRTGPPVRHWFGFRFPLPDSDTGRPVPGALIGMSEGLNAGFFESPPYRAAALAAIGISILLWVPFVRGITRTVGELTRATERVAAGRFDVTVNEGRSDELGRLGRAVNQMTERLAGFVSGQKRFLGDTAHELCSPLARMQMAVGILENKAAGDLQENIADLREEVNCMSGLVNELLSFSKAALQPAEIRLTTFPLKPVIDKAVRRECEGRAQVKVDVSDAIQVRAQADLLGRAVGNVLRNAVRHAAKHGPIGVKAEQRSGHVNLVIWDQGPGIPEEHLGRIFEPFHRPDLARTSTTGGAGLGMAIVKTCIESCGGIVRCKNRRVRGLKILIRLPAESTDTVMETAAWDSESSE